MNPDPQPPNISPQTSTTKSKFPYIIGTVAVLIIIVGITYYLISGHATATNSKTQTSIVPQGNSIATTIQQSTISTPQTTSNFSYPQLKIVSLTVSNSNIKQNQKQQIKFIISGGKPPYHYGMDINNASGSLIPEANWTASCQNPCNNTTIIISNFTPSDSFWLSEYFGNITIHGFVFDSLWESFQGNFSLEAANESLRHYAMANVTFYVSK